MKGLHPSFRTIAGFSPDSYRDQHAVQIKNFFREFVALLQGWDLVEGKLIAIDGSKFRAVNSRKNNFNERKLAEQLSYIDLKIENYISQLDDQDKEEHGDRKIDTAKIKEQIKKQQQRKKKYQALQQELSKSEQDQISTTDPDARSMPINHGRIEVSYNVQTVVDAKNCLIVHFENTNTNDRKALSGLAIETKKQLNKETIEALADKGYHNGEELDLCAQNGITTYVAVPDSSRSCEIPTPYYYGDKFIYDPKKDVYICPQKKILKGSGRWYTKGNGSKYENQVKHYKTPACKSCPVKALCTGGAGSVRGDFQGRFPRRNLGAGSGNVRVKFPRVPQLTVIVTNDIAINKHKNRDIDVNIKDRILKPIDQVFQAITNPDKLSGYFISRASGPIEQGETIIWYFDDVGVQLSVIIKTVSENELITFDWTASGIKTQVDIALIPIDANTTSVIITEKSFQLNNTEVLKALQQTQG